ncbi:hypothetical protein [Chryseobacterium turcicum]|uniref:Uncharacterized protein n=1 Tax=Chryseobacterium turcicum TaxID=2898076 RepID=A0A9Q3V4N3_9FLAO|nr:hypothetical protein [Chryseobacterium turcicum]MCD1118112.1 hypothetical protein [Chryseobacterium turcicum]
MDKDLELLVSYCFINHKTQYNSSNKIVTKKLIDSGVLTKIENETLEVYEINFYSDFFNKKLSVYSENILGKKMPSNLPEAYQFVDDFFNKINIYNGNYLWSGARQITQGLLSSMLKFFLENGLDINEIFKILEKEEKRKPHIIDFRLSYLFAISKFASLSDLKKCIIELANSSKNYEAEAFLGDLPRLNPDLAIELYNSVLEEGTDMKHFFLAKILYNFIKIDVDFVFEEAKKIFVSLPTTALFIFGRIPFTNEDDIIEVDKIVDNSKFSDDQISEYSYFLCKLIMNKSTPQLIKNKYFEILDNLIVSTEDNVLNAVFHTITFQLKDNDEEKYKLLHQYLSRTQNFSVVQNFFHNFSEPKYLFHLMVMTSRTTGWRYATELFDSALQNFWNIKNEETEHCIFELFSSRKHSLLGVQVIMSGYSKPYNVDLKKSTNIQQLNAIVACCKYPIFFERLLPLILPLRNSKSSKIRDCLISQLSILIKEAYGKTLYELIESQITKSKANQKFLEKMHIALDEYLIDKVERESINEFNPYLNEDEHLNLYYRLQNESQSKASKNADKKSIFGQFASTKIIVRGNSFKIGDKEINPLGKVSVSAMIDKRAYKDPEAFEISLNNFENGN